MLLTNMTSAPMPTFCVSAPTSSALTLLLEIRCPAVAARQTGQRNEWINFKAGETKITRAFTEAKIGDRHGGKCVRTITIEADVFSLSANSDLLLVNGIIPVSMY